MRWAWISGVFPVLAWAAEPTLAPPTEALPAEPQSFAVSHYELLQGYSPFVKSLEAAKETEKSPDLVVVGYGRMKGGGPCDYPTEGEFRKTGKNWFSLWLQRLSLPAFIGYQHVRSQDLRG